MDVAQAAADEAGLELVHVEIARSSGRGEAIIRVFIDKPEGVTHRDCAEVSRRIDAVLEAEEFMHNAYLLEVSSPGLERGLYKADDYARFAGSLATIKTRQAIGNQRNFRGRIAGLEGETIVFDDKTSGRVEIPVAIVVKANLEVDTDAEFRRAKELAQQKAETISEDNEED